MLEQSITLIIPCRNERENIEELIQRIPPFGKSQEIIFIEGSSIDGTFEEIKRLIPLYHQHTIKLFKQPGVGKAAAVHFGCMQASGEILIVLDADLTVPPEATEACYRILQSGQGRFVNGSRLSSPMEKNAMPFINRMGNALAAVFFSWLTGTKFDDTLCGLKGMLTTDYMQMPRAFPRFGQMDPFSDFDLLLGAHALNISIAQLPITYTCRRYGKSQISRLKDIWPLIWLCVLTGLDKIFRQ